jgi:hypothetical protein
MKRGNLPTKYEGKIMITVINKNLIENSAKN